MRWKPPFLLPKQTPKKLLPQSTAEEQLRSEEKTRKNHITDNKVFSEMLDILAMKCDELMTTRLHEAHQIDPLGPPRTLV